MARRRPVFLELALLLFLLPSPDLAQPGRFIDLLNVDPNDGDLFRLYGSTGRGDLGVPLSGGHDVDCDGNNDAIFSAMTASPLGRDNAGELFLVFGDGTTRGSLDTAVNPTRVLRILGATVKENAGTEVWMDDISDDGFADLLICRQNYSPPGRSGAGALTLVLGSEELRNLADGGEVLDLADFEPGGSSPPGLTVVTLLGAGHLDRLGIWVRTGDVTGDLIPDIVVGADRRVVPPGTVDNGTVYVIRGGSHFDMGSTTIDLADFGNLGFDLDGDVVAILPPIVPEPQTVDHYHFGGTVQVADLDANGRMEVLIGATLNRAGASLPPPNESAHGFGGAPRGHLYIVWDDALVDPWPNGLTFRVSDLPGQTTVVRGGNTAQFSNSNLGEELVGGDFDGDGNGDLFIGDLVSDITSGGRNNAGSGHVLFHASLLKGRDFLIQSPPAGVSQTVIYGPAAQAIAADTAAVADFNGDGISDLMVASPHGDPGDGRVAGISSRVFAGIMHVFFGRNGGWPAVVDLAAGALPPTSELYITEVYGGHGIAGSNGGDTLSYSADAGDMDGDGMDELITNEMLGDGVLSGTEDVGNLIIVSGRSLSLLFSDGFETGDMNIWSSSVPASPAPEAAIGRRIVVP